jgi:hypothetical protein
MPSPSGIDYPTRRPVATRLRAAIGIGVVMLAGGITALILWGIQDPQYGCGCGACQSLRSGDGNNPGGDIPRGQATDVSPAFSSTCRSSTATSRVAAACTAACTTTGGIAAATATAATSRADSGVVGHREGEGSSVSGRTEGTGCTGESEWVEALPHPNRTVHTSFGPEINRR